MNKQELRFRQIHLDFHTSPDIEGVGAHFDAVEFADMLQKAHVNSVTCFARCHHGMLYYESEKHPELVHPHLANRNILREQIEECHKRGIRVPIYTTVQWDHYNAKKHPEWRMLDETGKLLGERPYEAGFYGFLCVNTPYRDFLKEHVKELLDLFPTDGLFFDIIAFKDCSCAYCRAGMDAQGMDASKKEVRLAYARQMLNGFMMDMSAFIRQHNQECSIYYNHHVSPQTRPILEANSHLEVESLPSGAWGYVHFPIMMRYARNLGLDCLSMTGKFHTSWGDFHSFKNKAALEFECFRMLALGSKCLIGDQLDPNGALSKDVYDLIAPVYAQVEKKEPWCKKAEAVVDIGIFHPEEFHPLIDGTNLNSSMMGITSMLQRSSHQFDFIDTQCDFSRYKVLVLPDDIPVDGVFAGKLREYVREGGKIIASFASGMNADRTAFELDLLGVRLRKELTLADDGEPARGRVFPGNNYADFILPKGEIGKNLPETEHVMYVKGMEVDAAAGAKVLADVLLPYFNRTYRHFCSHRHTPSSGVKGYDGIVRNGNTIYFAHPIFKMYRDIAPNWCKQLFLNALDMLIDEPVLMHDGPATMLSAVNEQKEESRLIVHALHYIPERISQNIDVIEDVIPLYNVKMSLRTDRKVKDVELVPEQIKIAHQMRGARVEFVIPQITGHQMVAVCYDDANS